MAQRTTASTLRCGSMHADPARLLLSPGEAMRARQDKDLPAARTETPSHCVLAAAPDGKLLRETSCPRDRERRWAPTGPHDSFPRDEVDEDESLDFETASGDTEFPPGTTPLQPPGRTPGCMSMRVDLPDGGTAILTSGAVHRGGSYGPPTTPAASANGLEEFPSSVEELRGIAERTDATTVFGHGPERMRRLRTATEVHHT